MAARQLRWLHRLSFVLLSGVLLAFLASGCVWGVVRDADTGAPIVGAKVTLTDSQGQTVVATSDDRGIFSFGPSGGAATAPGRAEFKAQATGYGTVDQIRSIDYADNPNASLADPSSLWDVQNMEVRQGRGAYYHDTVMHISLVFPDGWKTVGDNAVGMGSAWPSDEGEESDTMCMMMGWPRGGQSLQSTMDALLELENIDGWKRHIESSGETTVNGLPAVKATIFAESASGSQIKELIYVIGLNDQWAYMILSETSAAEFRRLKPTFEQIVQSFRAD